uniref:CshA/CshB family fibrillar adhesin-related protein n=1 Tax=Streptococcus mitis TaxID=28037 RepID=UPI00066C6719
MFKLSRQQKDHRYFCGNRYEKYSIKKLKVGAASVLIGAGFLFGYNVDTVEAASATETTEAVVKKDDDTGLNQAQENTQAGTVSEPKADSETKAELAEKPKSNAGLEKSAEPVTPVKENEKEAEQASAVSAHTNTAAATETKPSVDLSLLQAKLADLEAQIERIRGNKKQASQIQNAEKLVADARQYLEALSTTQKEVDAKAKEISSLTSILKSIKAEEIVKENKNTDSRNGKKMQEGTGFREGGAAGTGVGADVVDATSTPAVARGEYTKREDAEAFTKQVTWLDFGDVAHWENIDNEGGKIYLKEGSKYSKEVIPGYVINIKVKSLKPFQATEIYRKRMEAANASEEEKATFNPNATNQHFGEGSGPSRVTADQQDGTWSEVRNNGIDTGNKKTSIGAGDWSNIGVQFEISATYKGKNVRPAVIMNDSESANHGENIILTTNGSPWERVLELKKERFVGGTFTPTPYKPINNYNLRHEDYPQSGGQNNANQLLGAMRGGLLTLADGTKFAPKYMTNPDQEMGGLGTGVFGPVTSSGGYSLPVLMTKDATEVGLYILSGGIQTAMMGVIPIDEGDAPESYGKASHTINTVNGVTGGEVKQPYLGSTRPDMDTGTTKDWYGDDNDSDADESVNQLLPENLKGSEGNIIKANISKSGNYTLTVQAHTGGAEKAYIRSWIDFNKNGQFDADEASEIATITTDGTVKLNFKNKRSADVETLLEAGARVRIATEESEIENPTGTAFSGEVEDFIAKITHPPKGEKKTTVGNIKETQREEIHFTAQGKNVYLEDHPNAEIDTTVQPTYIDNKTGQEVTLASDGTYTVEGEGTYKFAVSDNGKDVKVEFTPADGFIGKAHGVSIRRQDTNKTTTDWGVFNPTNDPSITNINSVLDSMDGMYIPEVRVPGEVTTSANNAESKNLQGLPQKGQPTFNVETAKNPVKPSAKYPAKLVDPTSNTVTEATTVNALEQGTNKVIGTYTIVPETGEVTFTPNKDFKGVPAPVTVSAEVELSHDKDGNITKKTLTGTYTPTIIPVTPTSENAKSEGIQGATQEGTPVFTAGKANVGTEENPVEKTVPLTISATNPAKFVVDGQPVET